MIGLSIFVSLSLCPLEQFVWQKNNHCRIYLSSVASTESVFKLFLILRRMKWSGSTECECERVQVDQVGQSGIH